MRIQTATGNVGIGTTSPYATLSVMLGNDYASHAASTAFAIGSSTAGTATTTLFSVSSTGTTTIANGLILNAGCCIKLERASTPAGSPKLLDLKRRQPSSTTLAHQRRHRDDDAMGDP